MTLAEIIAEGEALVAKGHASFFSHDVGAARALDLLPRLLAVAKAAVEMRATYGKLASLHSVESGIQTFGLDEDGELVETGRTPDIDKPDCEHCRVLAAFEAAVRGDAGTGEGR